MKRVDASKLPFGPDSRRKASWHWRWQQFYGSRRAVLHRVGEVKKKIDDGFVGVVGTTVCGRRGKLYMPGVVSRLEAPRCKRCCRKLGVPFGLGAPYNRLVEYKDA